MAWRRHRRRPGWSSGCWPPPTGPGSSRRCPATASARRERRRAQARAVRWAARPDPAVAALAAAASVAAAVALGITQVSTQHQLERRRERRRDRPGRHRARRPRRDRADQSGRQRHRRHLRHAAGSRRQRQRDGFPAVQPGLPGVGDEPVRRAFGGTDARQFPAGLLGRPGDRIGITVEPPGGTTRPPPRPSPSCPSSPALAGGCLRHGQEPGAGRPSPGPPQSCHTLYRLAV